MSEAHNFQDTGPEFTQQFIGAVQSVNEYKERHTGLSATVSGFIGMLIRIEDDDMPPPVSARDKGEMARELVSILQTDELAEMGIKLFDSRAPGVEAYDGSEAPTPADLPSSLIMIISDGEKFGETLSQLKPTEEQEVATKSCVDTLLYTAAHLIKTAHGEHFEDEEASRRAKDVASHQLSIFEDLSPVLVAGGFGTLGSFDTLAEYSTRNQAGTLTDYVGALDRGLLYDGFGPDKWHMDSTGEQLAKRWEQAIEYLKSLRDREEPSSYYSELFNKLRRDFDTALDWVAPRSKKDTLIWGQRAALEKINQTWEDDFQLENSFYLSERLDEGYEPTEFDPADKPPMKPKPREISPEKQLWKD